MKTYQQFLRKVSTNRNLYCQAGLALPFPIDEKEEIPIFIGMTTTTLCRALGRPTHLSDVA